MNEKKVRQSEGAAITRLLSVCSSLLVVARRIRTSTTWLLRTFSVTFSDTFLFLFLSLLISHTYSRTHTHFQSHSLTLLSSVLLSILGSDTQSPLGILILKKKTIFPGKIKKFGFQFLTNSHGRWKFQSLNFDRWKFFY